MTAHQGSSELRNERRIATTSLRSGARVLSSSIFRLWSTDLVETIKSISLGDCKSQSAIS